MLAKIAEIKLVNLVNTWEHLQAGDAAREMLALIHEDAAEQNNKIGLFKSHQRFPKVFQQRQELSVCEDTLAGLLPALAKELRVPRLEFVSMQNQGDYLIEVDASRKDVPKVCLFSFFIPLQTFCKLWIFLSQGLVRYGLGVSQSDLISGVTKILGFCLTCRLG